MYPARAGTVVPGLSGPVWHKPAPNGISFFAPLRKSFRAFQKENDMHRKRGSMPEKEDEDSHYPSFCDAFCF